MEKIFICYSRCSTCKRAKKFLDENKVSYISRDIKENSPNFEELRLWIKKSGLPIKRFFNTSGIKYRELGLKDRLMEMSEDEQIDLLASDGMLVKRPILLLDEKILLGFKEDQWKEIIK